jgi:hypothetical protein
LGREAGKGETMDPRIKRFEHCDHRFFPYLEKVLERLPSEVRERFLDDSALQIVALDSLAFDSSYYEFSLPLKYLIYLNTGSLTGPENSIIHTIVHEIAHWIVRKGGTGLREKDAEDLLVRWGFEDEIGATKYSTPGWESTGYKIGFQWASRQNAEYLLERFEQYYDEWNEERFSMERLDQLKYEVDAFSILREMGSVELLKGSGEAEDHRGPDYPSLEKGIVYGVMAMVKSLILVRYGRQIETMEEAEAEVVETLEKIHNDFSKLFSLSMFGKYSKEARALGIPELSIKIEELLKKARKR